MVRYRSKLWSMRKYLKDNDLKAMLRKYRQLKRSGVHSPRLEVDGRVVTISQIREHFRRKLPSGMPLERLPTPSRSECPTPLGFRHREREDSDSNSDYQASSRNRSDSGSSSGSSHDMRISVRTSPNYLATTSSSPYVNYSLPSSHLSPLQPLTFPSTFSNLPLDNDDTAIANSLAKMQCTFTTIFASHSNPSVPKSTLDTLCTHLDPQLFTIQRILKRPYANQSLSYLRAVFDMLQESVSKAPGPHFVRFQSKAHVDGREMSLLGSADSLFDAYLEPLQGCVKEILGGLYLYLDVLEPGSERAIAESEERLRSCAVL